MKSYATKKMWIIFGVTTVLLAAVASGDVNLAADGDSSETNAGPSPDSDHQLQQQPHLPPYGYPPYPGLQTATAGNFYPSSNQEIRIVYVERPPTPTSGLQPVVGLDQLLSGGGGHAPPPFIHHHHHRHHQEEYLKGNCSLKEVKKEGEICGPLGGIQEDCEDIEVNYMKLMTSEACYDVTRTICEEQSDEEEREICTYQFTHLERKAQAKGVKVKFVKVDEKKEVDPICEKISNKPVYGAPKTGYSEEEEEEEEEICTKFDQVTKVSKPEVESREFGVDVRSPEVVKTCITKRVQVPRIECRDEVERKCNMAPELVDSVEKIKVCRYGLAKEECRQSNLYLPQQTCVETDPPKPKHPTYSA